MAGRESEKIVFLEGKRLYLRPFEEGDLWRCLRWINDPEIRPFVIRQFPVDQYQEKRWIESLSHLQNPPCDIGLAIVLKDGDRHIGNIGLHQINWIDHKGQTGMLIGEKDCWNKGYGHEAKELLLDYAFNVLNLRRISSQVLTSNARSRACLEKSGYVLEGIRRQACFCQGRYVDELLFGLLVDDWQGRRRR